MIDEELQQEELDVDDEGIPENLNIGPDSDEIEDINEQDEIPVAKGVGKPSSNLDLEDLPSLEAKKKERDELERAMQEFLERGGKIQSVVDSEEK